MPQFNPAIIGAAALGTGTAAVGAQASDFINPKIPELETPAVESMSADEMKDRSKDTAETDVLLRRMRRYNRSKTILTQNQILGEAPITKKTLLGE